MTPFTYPISVDVVVAGDKKPEPSETMARLAVVAESLVSAMLPDKPALVTVAQVRVPLALIDVA